MWVRVWKAYSSTSVRCMLYGVWRNGVDFMLMDFPLCCNNFLLHIILNPSIRCPEVRYLTAYFSLHIHFARFSCTNKAKRVTFKILGAFIARSFITARMAIIQKWKRFILLLHMEIYSLKYCTAIEVYVQRFPIPKIKIKFFVIVLFCFVSFIRLHFIHVWCLFNKFKGHIRLDLIGKQFGNRTRKSFPISHFLMDEN